MKMDTQPKLWITTKPKHPAPNRRRAGIDFPRGATIEVMIVDGTDEEIAARVKRGEVVVNLAGARLLAGDDALIVSDIPPPPPPPPLANLLGGAPPQPTAPVHWIEFAGDLKLALPTALGAAEAVLVTALERLASALPDPRYLPVVRAFTAVLIASPLVVGDVLHRLRHAIVDIMPMRAHGSFGPAPWPSSLPPVRRQRPALNETLPTWMRTLAKVIGVQMPTMLVDTSHADVDRLYREHAEATRSTLYEVSNIEGLATRMAIVEASNVEALDAKLDMELAAIREAQRIGFVAWSDAMDRVRRIVVASIDDARATAATAATPSIVNFALDELARYGRGLPTSTVFGADDALAIVMGAVPLREIAIEPDAETVRLSVRTKPGIKRRRRAGEDFFSEPRIVDIHPDQAAEIEKDDALASYRVDPNAESIAELRARADALPALRAEREELQRQLAEARATTERDERLVMLEKAFAEALADSNSKRREKRLAELSAELEKVKAELLASVAATTKPTTGEEP
jgi:hypothetical protein